MTTLKGVMTVSDAAAQDAAYMGLHLDLSKLADSEGLGSSENVLAEERNFRFLGIWMMKNKVRGISRWKG